MEILASGPKTKKSRDSLALGELGELRVGKGWRYQCWNCNHQIKIDKPIPRKCPSCGSTSKSGFWGHLVTPGDIGKPDQKIEDGFSVKNSETIMSGGIKTPKRILSQLPDALACQQHQNNRVFEPSQGRERGRPRQAVPEDLILKLASQGFSSRAIVARLNEQGISISYKTVLRRLQASLL